VAEQKHSTINTAQLSPAATKKMTFKELLQSGQKTSKKMTLRIE